MKFSTFIIQLASCALSANAFAPTPIQRHEMTAVKPLHMTATLNTKPKEEEEKTDEELAESAAQFALKGDDADEDEDARKKQVFGQLGITEDELALGIDPDELVKYAVSKENLIELFMKDNPKFSRERADEEVSRFLMDSEVVNAYIKHKKNPPNLNQMMEDQQIPLGTYALYGVGGLALGSLKDNFIDKKFESGEWERPAFEFPSLPFFGGGASDSASDAVDAALNVAADAVDATSSSL